MPLSDFQRDVTSATTLKQINKILIEYLKTLNIKTFAFTYYSYYPNSHNKLKYDFSSANFNIWHKHYIDEGYEDIDSTLDIVYQTSLPIFWDVQQQVKSATSTRERQMRLDSIKFGAEKGLSIPIHGPQEDFAILLLVQMRGEKCLENWEALQYELFALAYYYYSYLEKILILEQPAQKQGLNQREIQCLLLIAKKYSVKKMAAELKITERTVNFHIQRLNKKLGTENKYQSLMKALQKGLIKV